MSFTELDQLPQQEIFPKCRVRFVHSENMTLSYWNLEEGAGLPSHSHPHEQVCNMIEGRMELTVGGLVKVDEHGRTSRKGVYAGGDIVNGGTTAVRAVAEGMRAAEAIDRDLNS